MKTKHVEWVIYHSRWLMLGGLVDYAACLHFPAVGTLTAWMAIQLGASGAVCCQWRKERGLWMLSGLFLAFDLPMFAIFVYGSLSDLAHTGVPSLMAIDLWFANLFLAVQVLFLATVTRTNWSLKKKPEMPEL